MSVARTIMAEVPFDDLPDSAEVTGEAVKSGGLDMRGESNAPTVVASFRRRKLGDVRKEIGDKDYDKVTITDIRF